MKLSKNQKAALKDFLHEISYHEEDALDFLNAFYDAFCYDKDTGDPEYRARGHYIYRAMETFLHQLILFG